jgi:predicted DNA-binding transcriptional regulator AlpA
MTTKIEGRGEEILLRTGQTAKRLGVSERYLEILRVRGDGPPFVSLGRCVRYRPSDVDLWVGTRLRRSTSDQPNATVNASFLAHREKGKGTARKQAVAAAQTPVSEEIA